MPAGMTFATLKDDVANYLERSNSAVNDPLVYAQLPSLINLAERRIARDLKILGLINTVVSTFTSGTAVYQKPDRWRQTVSINFGTGTGNETRNQVFPRSYEYIRFYWPDPTATGTPKFYADYNAQNWIFGPTPDAAYPFEVLFYELPELLDDSTQTNWLTEYMPETLLYASLFETAAFIKNTDQMGVWQGFYEKSRGAVMQEDMSKIIDRTSTRSGD
jgi:hypothetical protein